MRKPLLLYLTTTSEEDRKVNDKIQKVVFKDERVQIGAKLFTLVKLPRDRADDRIEKLVGRSNGPTLAAFSGSGKRVGVVTSKASASKLYGVMKTAAKKDYRTSLSSLVSKMKKILTAIDKLEGKKGALQKRLGKGNKKIDQQIREVEEELKKLDAEERAIWEKLLERNRA